MPLLFAAVDVPENAVDDVPNIAESNEIRFDIKQNIQKILLFISNIYKLHLNR